MKAILVSYSTKGLSKSDSSKISKFFLGYIDKSNGGLYQYKREGFIADQEGIIISKSTFIIPSKAEAELNKIKKKGLKLKKWLIDIPKKEFVT